MVLLGAMLVLAVPRGASAFTDDIDMLTVSGGWSDVFDNDQAAELLVEYRSGYRLLGLLKPFAGFSVTSKGATYLNGGLRLEFEFADNWFFTPSTSVGWYNQGGGKDLGNALEFRSAAELSYRFENQSRIGISIAHMSNAGISSRNPGTEIVSVNYSIPLQNLLGN